MKLIKNIFILLIMIILPASLFAADFGLVANLFTGLGNSDAGDGSELKPIELKADILPRLSLLVGDNSDLFISAGLKFITEEGEFNIVPELLRTELTLRFGNSGFKFGRMNYSDPLSFIASGLFDGLQFYNKSSAGKFIVGAWYTGFIYRKNNEITMTANDDTIFFTSFSFDDFANTYFGPKRAFAALEWDHPSIGEILSLKISAIGQMDLNENDQYHNQYFIFKAGIPVKSMIFELGGAMEFSQSGGNFNMAYAGDLGFTWMLPTSIVSRLSLNGRIAGWKTDDLFNAFMPITTKYYGSIIKQKMTGLTVINLDYLARLGDPIGMNLTASCFIRDDNGTFRGPATELFARFIWSPVSDIQLNFGGGAYLPFLSNSGADDKLQWRAELTATISFI